MIFNSNNCIDHALWAIQTFGGYQRRRDYYSYSAPQPESEKLYKIAKTHFWIKVLTTVGMFLLPILIGLSINGLWSIIDLYQAVANLTESAIN